MGRVAAIVKAHFAPQSQYDRHMIKAEPSASIIPGGNCKVRY